MTNTISNQTTATCDFCILQDIYTTDATQVCETCHLNCCDDCAGDNYNLDHARVDSYPRRIAINRECLG